MIRAAAVAVLVTSAALYLAAFAVLAWHLWESVTGRPAPAHAAPGMDPVDAELEQILTDGDLEAMVNATRCDCPPCKARRQAMERQGEA